MKKLFIVLLLAIPVGAQTIIQTSAQLGMKCDGVTDDTQRFLNALGIGGGANNVYLIFNNGTCNIKSVNPITVPSTLTLDFTQQGALSLASGSTMNVNAAIVDLDSHAIFNGSGTYNITPRNSTSCNAIAGGISCSSGGTSFQTTTAAAAGNAIALGSGATNANSVDGGAGTSPLSMTLNINVGDFVILFTNTQDTSVTVADNGANGGNVYIPLGQFGSARGKPLIWYVPAATVSASQITVTDAANVYTISGATYLNVQGVGTPVSVGASNNAPSVAVTTLVANSLVVGCYTFNASTTFAATSGSIVTSSFNNTNTINTGMMSITTTTAGSYTLSATTTQGSPSGQWLAVELLVNTGTNHSAPLITYTGTGWTGSASINEVATLQAVVPNVTNPLAAITVTPSFAVFNAGSFTNTQANTYLSSSIGGVNAQTEFIGVSRPAGSFQASAVFGGVSIPAASTQTEAHGVYGAINNYSPGNTFGVGAYFSGRALAASTKTYGMNSIVMDGGFATTNLISAEMDITQSNADASGPTAVSNGIRILSNGTHRPASGIYILGQNSTDNFLAPIVIDDASSGDTAANRMIYLIPPDNLNTTVAVQLRNHTNAADVLQISDAGAITPSLYQSLTNCSSSASPAVCAAAPAGSVAIANPATTIQVNTTAVTANSQIFVQEDSSLGTKLGVTCNTTAGRTYQVTARSAATSFTITASATPATNDACLSYFIVN